MCSGTGSSSICKSQQGEEGKQASNSKDTDDKSMQHEADWTLVSMQSRRKSLPLAPEIALTNSYEALGNKKKEVWRTPHNQQGTTM